MSTKACARLVAVLLAGAALAGCGGKGGAPGVAARVEGTEIPSSQTEALLAGHLQNELAKAGSGGQELDGERKETLTHFVLLYQIKHALLRHLARGMNVAVEPGGNLSPEAEAGRLSHAMAERLFAAAPEEQRQGLFMDWFDKELRRAKVWVDGHFGRWDSERGVVQ